MFSYCSRLLVFRELSNGGKPKRVSGNLAIMVMQKPQAMKSQCKFCSIYKTCFDFSDRFVSKLQPEDQLGHHVQERHLSL